MITNIYQRYAELLTNYCLSVKKGDKVYVASTYLAEPLLQQILVSVAKAGGHCIVNAAFQEQGSVEVPYQQNFQLEWENPLTRHIIENFDCYLVVRAPFNNRGPKNHDAEKQKLARKASAEIQKLYMQRTGDGSMRRSLCQFPTLASAQDAGMSLSEYERFVFDACNLYDENPIASWQNLGKQQQTIVDYLNQRKLVVYKGENIDISFSTEGRTWINSDGKSNMPSGEVFTAPVENSVNGWVKFTYPSIYTGEAVEEVELVVENGEIVQWNAKTGKALLDKIFAVEGARRFGEAAVGTNFKIQEITKNILFDEKIGGSIHLAVGQSYYQCGGKNESAVHWDMITDMKTDGIILADGEKIYEKGKFLIS